MVEIGRLCSLAQSTYKLDVPRSFDPKASDKGLVISFGRALVEFSRDFSVSYKSYAAWAVLNKS